MEVKTASRKPQAARSSAAERRGWSHMDTTMGIGILREGEGGDGEEEEKGKREGGERWRGGKNERKRGEKVVHFAPPPPPPTPITPSPSYLESAPTH